MHLRQMATAFLFRNDAVLMMKRSGNHLIPAGYWTGIGGHLEAFELNNPFAACIRELHEETGIQSNEVEDLTLRYILFRKKDNEIRQQFVYFGNTCKTELASCEEGELHWIHSHDLLELEMSRVIQLMLEHYFVNRHHNETFIGTITLSEQQIPEVKWCELVDPKVF